MTDTPSSQSTPGERKATAGFVAALILLLAGCVIHILAGYSHADLSGHARGCDDAYISFRYAQNFAAGHGLVFNPGERVEGYSNLLYVLLLSLSFLVPGISTYSFALLINIACICAAMLAFYSFARERLGTGRALAGAMLFGLCPPVWIWTASGMEGPLVLLLQILLWTAVVKTSEEIEIKTLVVLLTSSALLILARADGFVMPIIVLAYFLITRRFRLMLYTGMVVALTLIVVFLWRYVYYGDLLPNTYYAKVSGSMLGRVSLAFGQLAGIAIYHGILLHLAVLILVVVLGIINHWRLGAGAVKKTGFAPFFAFGWLAYWIYVGGDVFQERFLLIVYLTGIFVMLRLAADIRHAKFLYAIVAVFALAQMSIIPLDARFDYGFPKYDRWVTLGKFLGEKHPGESLAVDASGKIPFFSGLKTIDILGLNDRHIGHIQTGGLLVGHNKFDPDYVLARKPDLIASWADPNLDLAWGMVKVKYEQAGYHFKYLVNARKHSYDVNILDVSSLGETDIRRLIENGYSYAVISR